MKQLLRVVPMDYCVGVRHGGIEAQSCITKSSQLLYNLSLVSKYTCFKVTKAQEVVCGYCSRDVDTKNAIVYIESGVTNFNEVYLFDIAMLKHHVFAVKSSLTVLTLSAQGHNGSEGTDRWTRQFQNFSLRSAIFGFI